jgi:hypothetical protein
MTVEFIKLLYMLQRKQDNSEAHLWQKLKHKSDRPFNSVAAVCSLPDPLCVCVRGCDRRQVQRCLDGAEPLNLEGHGETLLLTA